MNTRKKDFKRYNKVNCVYYLISLILFIYLF